MKTVGIIGGIGLATRDDVTEVRYPGLPKDPAHEIASRQMQYFSSVISFVLAAGRSQLLNIIG